MPTALENSAASAIDELTALVEPFRGRVDVVADVEARGEALPGRDIRSLVVA